MGFATRHSNIRLELTTAVPLNLTSVCSENPGLERRWRVTNPNAFPVAYTWKVFDTAFEGSGIVSPGKSHFFSPAVGGPNTTLLYWRDENNVEQFRTKASGGETCAPAFPVFSLSPSGSNVIVGSNGLIYLMGGAALSLQINDLGTGAAASGFTYEWSFDGVTWQGNHAPGSGNLVIAQPQSGVLMVRPRGVNATFANVASISVLVLTTGSPFKIAKYDGNGALGVAQMHEDVNGNVGIGTTNAQYKLNLSQQSEGVMNKMLKISNHHLSTHVGSRENLITLDNNEAEGTSNYVGWRLGAAVVGDNYFRIMGAVGTRPIPTLDFFHIDGLSGNVGIGNAVPSAKLHIAAEKDGPGDLDLLRLSNIWNFQGGVLKEPTISLDNGQVDPVAWKLSAGVVATDYFRIRRKSPPFTNPNIPRREDDHLIMNTFGQTHLRSRFRDGNKNQVLRLSNIWDNTSNVENEISIDNGVLPNATGWKIGAGVVGDEFFRVSHFAPNQEFEHFRINANGNVCIGTGQPATRLFVSGSATEPAILTLDAPAAQAKGIVLSDAGTSKWRIAQEANSSNLVIGDGDLNNSIRIIKDINIIGTTPRVVIGEKTISPANSSQFGNNPIKLSVDGVGVFKELAVLEPGQWADYVFEKEYKLLPIDSVETFIKQNHHLPNVPSAAEVFQNGIKLGEMNAILLRKIEELTLYVIELKKELNTVKNK